MFAEGAEPVHTGHDLRAAVVNGRRRQRCPTPNVLLREHEGTGARWGRCAAVDVGPLGWPGLKEAVQLLGGGLAVEGPVATGLLVGGEPYRHLGVGRRARRVPLLRWSGRSDNMLGGTVGLAGQRAAAELEDELTVGQLVTLVGAIDSVRQHGKAHLCVPIAPSFWRTWHSMAPDENDRSWRSSCQLGHYLWGAGWPPVPVKLERIFGTIVR